MTDAQTPTIEWELKWTQAQLALAIWNPNTWGLHPNKARGRQLQLYYRAKGIVLHDQMLNGEARND